MIRRQRRQVRESATPAGWGAARTRAALFFNRLDRAVGIRTRMSNRAHSARLDRFIDAWI